MFAGVDPRDRAKAILRRVLAERADVRVAILFGSAARGTARADSDVDLAVHAPGTDLVDRRNARSSRSGGVCARNCAVDCIEATIEDVGIGV